jgi:uncharacterized protein
MDDAPRAPKLPPCPICGKPAQSRHQPFCSERCQLVDLGRWLGGRYRIGTDERPDDAPAGETPPARDAKDGG